MSLPKGFGRGWDGPDTEDKRPPKKCKLGKICDDNYPHYKRCSIHNWTWEHDDAWIALRVIGLMALIICIPVITVQLNYENGEPMRNHIEGFNCNQLAEYIADKSSEYEYAEHRYEWLCVNEKIKEFQG